MPEVKFDVDHQKAAHVVRVHGEFRMPVLVIDAGPKGAAYVIRVRGELDMAACPRFERVLGEAERSQGRPILVDIEELAFIDMAGLRSIIDATHRAASNGDRLRMTRGSGQVARLFRLTSISRALPLVAAGGMDVYRR